MIEKNRIEQHMSWVERQISNDYVKVSVFAEDYRKLLTDYLALRAVVEALAAEETDTFMDNDRCQYCDQRIGKIEYEGNEFEWIMTDHAETCIHRQAVALVGPAGEREEGD